MPAPFLILSAHILKSINHSGLHSKPEARTLTFKNFCPALLHAPDTFAQSQVCCVCVCVCVCT
jgi:hypothetical protein